MRQAFSLILCLSLLSGCQKEEPKPPTASSEPTNSPATAEAPAGMVFIPGGTYTRGSHKKIKGRADYPEEFPAHPVTVDAFFIDTHEVTNAEFLKFAEATGYKTRAERGWADANLPLAPKDSLQPGAILFVQENQQKDPWNGSVWDRWAFTPGASWRHPYGPTSSIDDILDHPVTCVTFEDATAYAKWAGKRLPTEAEWERASRGGHEGQIFPWGNKALPDGKWMTNCFQGTFPAKNEKGDGHIATAPVGSFPPNDYGLYDMVGNVWEICSDYYSPTSYTEFIKSPHPNPTGITKPINEPQLQQWMQSGQFPAQPQPIHKLSELHVTRGGSYLCHYSYCLRFRNASRHYSESFSPTNHTGFRCVKDLP